MPERRAPLPGNLFGARLRTYKAYINHSRDLRRKNPHYREDLKGKDLLACRSVLLPYTVCRMRLRCTRLACAKPCQVLQRIYTIISVARGRLKLSNYHPT